MTSEEILRAEIKTLKDQIEIYKLREMSNIHIIHDYQQIEKPLRFGYGYFIVIIILSNIATIALYKLSGI